MRYEAEVQKTVKLARCDVDITVLAHDHSEPPMSSRSSASVWPDPRHRSDLREGGITH